MTPRRLKPFVRVSSDKQSQNASRDAQLAVIRAWAACQSNPPVELLDPVSVVESATCAADHRPEFMAALESLDDADGMIVYSIDRFFRNTEEGLRVAREQFIEKDRYFVSVNEAIDISTDDGWFMLGMFLLIAEKEAKTIKRRFAAGRKIKQARGGYIGGEAPYGWRPDGNGGLTEDRFEQVIVQQVVELSTHHMNASQIAAKLNLDGVVTRKGKEWTYKQIQSILERNKGSVPA